MLSVSVILLVVALVTTIMNIVGKCPLWVSVLLVEIALLLRSIPA